MKSVFSLGALLVLTGCAFGTSKEIQIAEKLISQFECKNIDTEQLTHNPITGFHQRTLSVSKDRALQYIELYKSGESPVEMPLDDMVQQQYITYKSACELLGGLTTELINSDLDIDH